MDYVFVARLRPLAFARLMSRVLASSVFLIRLSVACVLASAVLDACAQPDVIVSLVCLVALIVDVRLMCALSDLSH